MSHFISRKVGPWGEALPTQAFQWNILNRGKNGHQIPGTKLSSNMDGAVRVPQGSSCPEQPFALVPLPTARYPALCALTPGRVGRELVCLSLQKTWVGINHTAVTLCRSAGDGCWWQAEDAASSLSVERVAHLPASACHVAGNCSHLPPVLCLIPSIFCSVPEVSLTPSPSTLSAAPVRIFMRWEDSLGRDQKKAGTLHCERFLGFCHCASDPEAWQAEQSGQHDPVD